VSSDFSEPERQLGARLAAGDGPIGSEILDLARRHRVHLLLASSIAPAERARPDLSELARELRTAAALDAVRERHVQSLLTAFMAAGIDILLLKGTALAYIVYPAPHLRPRADIDVMIQRHTLDAAERVLATRGWTRPTERDAELSAAQRHYVKSRPSGVLEHLDVHWKIANPQTFANALAFDELRARAVQIPALGPGAWTLSRADALFLACVHRVAHHDDALQMLWLWDIHLLCRLLCDSDADRVVTLADRSAMWSVCRRSLDLARELFATLSADTLSRRLEERGAGHAEPSAQFIGGAKQAAILRADLAAMSRWRDRVTLLAEHVFPSAAYMRAAYPRCPSVLLPVAYAHRIVRGTPKWFRRD
jgi:hypothetical protein